MKFQKIVTEINNAFFRLESFMNGTIMDYQYFGFKEAFINLFTEARKHENFNYDNCKLIGKYWQLTEQIRIDTDKGDYENCEIAIDNKMFCKDCDEILYLNWERIEDFEEFLTPDEITESERKYSITDILKAPALPPQPIVKQKPEPNEKVITLKNDETIKNVHSELKGYFPNKEAELLKALQGEQLSEILLFPHNQNKFVEVFRRLKYNGFLLNTDTETKNWICTTFQFVKKGFAEPQPFNEGSVWRNLNMGKGEPPKKERICITEWLPYKSPLQLTREKENEKL